MDLGFCIQGKSIPSEHLFYIVTFCQHCTFQKMYFTKSTAFVIFRLPRRQFLSKANCQLKEALLLKNNVPFQTRALT